MQRAMIDPRKKWGKEGGHQFAKLLPCLCLWLDHSVVRSRNSTVHHRSSMVTSVVAVVAVVLY